MMLPMVSIYLLKVPQLSSKRNVTLIHVFQNKFNFSNKGKELISMVMGGTEGVGNYSRQIFAFIDLKRTTYNNKVWPRKLRNI